MERSHCDAQCIEKRGKEDNRGSVHNNERNNERQGRLRQTITSCREALPSSGKERTKQAISELHSQATGREYEKAPHAVLLDGKHFSPHFTMVRPAPRKRLHLFPSLEEED